MPAQTEASIPPSFRSPPPKIDHPDVAEPVPAVPKDWTTTAGQTADGIAAGAKGQRHVVNPAVAANRRLAEGG